MRASINRRQLLVGAGAGALGTAAALGAAPLGALASEVEEGGGVEGSWYVSVTVTSPSPASFDTTYAFANGGVFTRIDGRTNAPALGTWKRAEGGGIVFSAILFNSTPERFPAPPLEAAPSWPTSPRTWRRTAPWSERSPPTASWG
jgi:hypothetical protein